MKKLFCLLLVLLLVPLVAFSDEQDPIVGCWYIYYNKSITPEMESIYPDCDICFTIYVFDNSGVVYASNSIILGTAGKSEYSTAGKWEKTESGYNIGLLGVGEGNAFIENDYLLLAVQNTSDYYAKFRKLYNFNPYKDYVRR